MNLLRHAFPTPKDTIPGMELRDYVATHALAGMLADPNVEIKDNEAIRSVAEFSYDLADAMLLARVKRQAG
jgi:hypothetical protein